MTDVWGIDRGVHAQGAAETTVKARTSHVLLWFVYRDDGRSSARRRERPRRRAEIDIFRRRGCVYFESVTNGESRTPMRVVLQ